jgi:serine/threonine-protein kinase
MSEPRPAADLNLLFGVLALQMDFIDRDALINGLQRWVFDKTRSLGQILHEQGQLSADRVRLLDALVQAHLQVHGDDPQRSLAAVSVSRPLASDLQVVVDADLQASLAHAAAGAADPDSTVDHVPAGTGSSRFRILRPHARGGLGEVFVAEDQELCREVALKEIQTKYADDPVSRRRFVLEAEITGRLEHPGIVAVYGLGQHPDDRPYYAMRFIRGESLKEAIKRFHSYKGPQPFGDIVGSSRLRRDAFRELLGRFVDACNAVAYAHSRGVLHRDLKPSNVMLGKYGETLVVDWGLAKVIGRSAAAMEGDDATLWPSSANSPAETQAGTAVGTPQYMSPEQAAGRVGELGPSSDIFSLGATLYTLLTGQAPFSGSDVGEVLRKVQRGEFTPPGKAKPGTPAPLSAICCKAMASSQNDRYATALELAADVTRWLANDPVSAYREPVFRRLQRWSLRYPLPFSVVAVLLMSLITAGTAVLQMRRDHYQEKRHAEEIFSLRYAAGQVAIQCIADRRHAETFASSAEFMGE